MMFVDGKLDGNNNVVDVTIGASRNSGTDETTKTGQNIIDKVSNIYDLEGSRSEWTQEVNSVNSRVYRGRTDVPCVLYF